MKAQILLATHNPDMELFARQLASLVAQTEPDWQCLVFDDSSNDRLAVRDSLPDERFHLLPATEHLGPFRAFGALLSAAGPVPAFLCDQDDHWHPEKLSRMLEIDGPVFSAMRVVDPAGSVVRPRFLPPPTDLSAAGLLLMNCVPGTALKITDEVRRAGLPLPAPGLRGWHDQWLAAVAARVGSLIYLDEPLVDYTQHSEQVIGDGLRRISAQRLRRFIGQPQLRSRARWVMSAAFRLLQLPGPDDPDLQAVAAGDFRQVLGRYDLPPQRAALLTVGRLLPGR